MTQPAQEGSTSVSPVEELQNELDKGEEVPPGESVVLRPAVLAFAEAMERKLRENDHKGGWDDMTPGQVLTRIEEETCELSDELRTLRRTKNTRLMAIAREVAADEAVDVANFCFFLFDNLRAGR